MPSIRKRLKKLTSSKKSKSTSDLDQMRPTDADGFSQSKDDDTSSQISEAVSERTDISAVTTESSYSYSHSGEKKKKRRLRLTFPRSKKKEKLIQNPSGNVIFRSMSVEHDPRGNVLNRSSPDVTDDSNLKPQSQNISRSVGDILEAEENPDVDSWRMSGLLENVDRASSSSSAHDLSSGKDNLITTFEERRKKNFLTEPTQSSTPLKSEDEEILGNTKSEETTEGNTGKITAIISPVNIKVSFTEPANVKPEKEQEKELIRIEEDVIEETRNVDPECHMEIADDESVTKSEEFSDRSFVYDIGRGKKVVIRHLTEVVSDGNVEMSNKVSTDDWLVLNMMKDDWVVVGYSKVGGEVTQLFDRSVEVI